MNNIYIICLLTYVIQHILAGGPIIIRCLDRNTEISNCVCFNQRYCGSLDYNGGVNLNSCPENGCVRGCICRQGLYFNELINRCVLPQNCQKPCCPVNRVWNDCGTACPLSCEFPRPRPCTKQCVRGCFCKLGLVEDGNGNCIPPDQCPPKCPGNEIYDPCANPCQPNCVLPFRSPCLSLPCKPGCVCRPPLVRDEVSGRCVDKRTCDAKCLKPNEVYYKCKPCLQTCHTCVGFIPKCTAPTVCVSGCQCKPGYLWHPTKRICVLAEFCQC